MALPMVLLLKLLAVLVGNVQTGVAVTGALRSALAFTVHDHGPMALLGLLIAAMAIQANARSMTGQAMAQRLITGALAILLAILLLGSAILLEVELRQDFAQQQAAMEQEAVQLRDKLTEIQSSAFLDALAEPGRLEELRSGFPDLPPDADAEETVAALRQVVLQDLNQLQQAQENHSTQGAWESWGARWFHQLPDGVLAVGAAVIAGVVLAGAENAENKATPAKDHQPTD
ncbi:MAG: hypothetical protein F4026_04120 [Synechococcus sp. SB0669_bin_8]|nr:hypothetical protein [Synechococcus sp. SB0675_bin_6]MYK91327.1 hypothetical protein [Synechococcus sp. SB0669_bin_8]